jgi:hypothetical protein
VQYHPNDQAPHHATKSPWPSKYILLQDGTKSLCLPAQHQAGSGHYIGNYIVAETVMDK